MMLYANGYLNAKIAKRSRDLCFFGVLNLVRGFYQSPDAAGAQCFANHLPIFVNGNLLKVGFKLSFGSPHRVASALTKSRLFSTFLTDRHDVVLSQLKL